MFWLTLLMAAHATTSPQPQLAAPRGVWMYQHSAGDPYGTPAVVATPWSRDWALTRLSSRNIRRVYGSYGNLPVDDATYERVASWNTALHLSGINSQLLLGSPSDLHPGCRDDLLDKVQERLIDLHDRADIDPILEGFDAVHLDVEPHGQNSTVDCAGTLHPAWGTSAALNAERMLGLYDTAVEVRALLDASGASGVHLELDLAFWFDSTTQIDWSVLPAPYDTAQGWFEELSQVADSVTLMTYEEDNTDTIKARAASEAAWMDPHQVRVAVSARERPGEGGVITWSGPSAFWGAVSELETIDPLMGGYGVDLFQYRSLFRPWWGRILRRR